MQQFLKDRDQVLSYIATQEVINTGIRPVEPPQYPDKFYQLLYPREIVRDALGRIKYRFLETGDIVTNPIAYVYYKELLRFNPNANFVSTKYAAFVSHGLQACDVFPHADDPAYYAYYQRQNVYTHVVSFVEQAHLEAMPWIQRFPRYERLGLATYIRNGYTDLVAYMHHSEQIPSLRKQYIRDFQVTLHKLRSNWNMAYNSKYVNLQTHIHLTKKLKEISSIHDAYIAFVLKQFKHLAGDDIGLPPTEAVTPVVNKN